MEWSEECRIKHLSTGQYLAVTGNSPDYMVCFMNTEAFISTIATNYTRLPCYISLHSGDTEELQGSICINDF